MKKIFYWANDIEGNSGRRYFGKKFYRFIKKKFKNYKFINLNKIKKRNNILYNYLTPLCGI